VLDWDGKRVQWQYRCWYTFGQAYMQSDFGGPNGDGAYPNDASAQAVLNAFAADLG
jgi:hypothetical protein